MFPGRGSGARAAAVLAAAGLALGAAACGSGAAGGEQVELRFSWWGDANRAALTKEAVALFERRHPDVDVSTSFQEFEPYWQRMATETAGGGAPDVFQMDYSYLNEYAGRGALLDLGEHDGRTLRLDGLVPGVEKAGVVDGSRVAVPWTTNTFATMYVPELYEQAGVEPPQAGDTWAEFHEKISRFDGATSGVYGSADYTGVMYVFEIQLRQRGGTFFTADGKLGFEPADLEAFWRQGQRLQAAGAFLPVRKAVQAQPISALGSQQTATEMSWDNFLVRYEDEQDRDVEVAPLPEGGDHVGQYVKPSMLLSASARTEHPEEAAELVDFLVNDPQAAKILGANRGLPATRGAREAAELTGVDAEVAAYEEAMADRLEPTPVTPPAGAGSLEATFIRLHEELSYGRITVDQAVARFFDEADRLLES